MVIFENLTFVFSIQLMVDTRIGPLGHLAASPAGVAHGSEIAFALVHHPPIMGNPVQERATKKKIVTPNRAQVSHRALKGCI